MKKRVICKLYSCSTCSNTVGRMQQFSSSQRLPVPKSRSQSQAQDTGSQDGSGSGTEERFRVRLRSGIHLPRGQDWRPSRRRQTNLWKKTRM